MIEAFPDASNKGTARGDREEGRLHVDSRGLLVVSLAHVEPCWSRDSGMGIENVDLAVSCADIGHQRLDLGHIADIDGECAGRSPGCGDQIHSLNGGISAKIRHHHVGPLGGHAPGGRSTHSRAGRGNHGYTSFQHSHVNPHATPPPPWPLVQSARAGMLPEGREPTIRLVWFTTALALECPRETRPWTHMIRLTA